jgi:hypothetical protein
MQNRNALALTFQTGGDGSGSLFLIVIFEDGAYRIIFSKIVLQGRLVLGLNNLILWSSEGSEECVWCSTRYKKITLRLKHGKYFSTSVRRLKPLYDPAAISNKPLMIASEVGHDQISNIKK